MECLRAGKADFKKIVLWATFHPEMTSVDEFAARVAKLSSLINLSVGVVGNPCSLLVIKQLRKKLPSHIYLWINQMDGMNRRYTAEENRFFKSIDPMFEWELRRGEKQGCEGGRIHWFVNAKGDLSACNRAADKIGNFYDLSSGIRQVVCSGKRCD